MTLISMFLMNVLCAMVPCDSPKPHPEIGIRNENSDFTGSIRGKRLIHEGSYPIVSTDLGQVQGFTMKVMSGRDISAFEGIPYAEYPARFELAAPKKAWTGIRKAFQPGSHCLQIHPGKMFRVIGSENCLFLNVYTPKLPIEGLSKNLPVLVLIHGGSYAFSAGSEYGPSYLLEQDVILVTFNYRLGVLGFMSTGDDVSPGNLGLKDQALALKWISENIAFFGGDSSRITLIGQSAGASSVHLHMLSNMTRNYFQQAIAISGTAHAHWAIQNTTRARSWTNSIARLVNCPTISSIELVQCLKKMNGNWLVGMQMNLFDWIPFPPVLFAPVIENPNPSSFLTESPEDICRNGGELKIPAIFTMTSQEGYFLNYALNGLMKIGSFINNVRKYLPYYLDYKYIADNSTEITEKVLSHYIGDVPPRNVPIQMYAEMATDRMFTVPINKAIKYHAKQARTYASLFSYLGKYNAASLVGVPKNERGVAHSEDMYYLFNASLYVQGFMQNDKEAELSKLMVNLFTNFAAKGVPVYTDTNGTDVEIWEPVKPEDEEIRMLQLNQNVHMIEDKFVQRRIFWENLGLEDSTSISYTDNYEDDRKKTESVGI